MMGSPTTEAGRQAEETQHSGHPDQWFLPR
jgi:hypothetical protein